jgi:hypothetical protein
MDLYVISLATGAAGLGVMALTGASHGGHPGHAGSGHAHPGHDVQAGHAGHAHYGGGRSPAWAQSFLSPRLLFALMVGFGAGGLLATPLGEPWRLGAAILAAAGFEALLAGPLWRFLFRFESTPAATLDSAIEDEARAVTGFDANGNGLVALDIDGQIVQLLGTLSADDRARGVRVRTGDRLIVSSVDAARNRCVVRLMDR